jgi:hypothetical protein
MIRLSAGLPGWADGSPAATEYGRRIAISDPNLSGGPDWTGADVVIRKNRFILDRSTIMSQQGSTRNYKGGSFYQAMDKFGYFIQNDIRTLDQAGEWYYDPNSKTMNIYFGSGQPAPDVLASSVDTLVSIFLRRMGSVRSVLPT